MELKVHIHISKIWVRQKLKLRFLLYEYFKIGSILNFLTHLKVLSESMFLMQSNQYISIDV